MRCKPESIVGERFLWVRVDPMNVSGLEAFRQPHMGKKAMVGANPGDKINFQDCNMGYKLLILTMNRKELFPESLYDLYKTLGIPVDMLDQADEFTVHDVKDLLTELPIDSPRFRPNYFNFLFAGMCMVAVPSTMWPMISNRVRSIIPIRDVTGHLAGIRLKAPG